MGIPLYKAVLSSLPLEVSNVSFLIVCLGMGLSSSCLGTCVLPVPGYLFPSSGLEVFSHDCLKCI